MDNPVNKNCKKLLALFIFQLLINWVYVSWIQYNTPTISNAWIALLPLFAFFYFIFAIIAYIEMLQNTKLGLSLAYAVLMFGLGSAVVSYDLVPQEHDQAGTVLAVLVVINIICTILLRARMSIIIWLI